MTPEHTRMAHRIVRKLSESCDRLPSALFITGVSGCDDHPTFGGGYGDIFHAFHNGRPVALKRMRYFLRGSDLRRIRLKFCREALVWKDLHHPHILPFMGIDRDSFPSSLCMVSPWMEHGTIINYMNQHGHANVDKLLYEIAQGLQYLHSQNIVHGDLRGTNILITEDWRACLTDFGLSVFSDATSSMTTNRGGSLYWMAPELLDPDKYGLKFVRTTATDVYAYGCVCLEVYTGRPPFAHLPEPAALMKILQGERPQRPSGSPAMTDILWRNISTYWADSPTARPDTQLVVHNMVWATPEWPLRSFDPASPPLANKFDQPRSPGPSPAAATSTVTAGNDPASRPVKSPSKWLNRMSNPLINILPSRFFPVDAKSPPPDGQLPTLGENEYEVLYDCYEAVYDSRFPMIQTKYTSRKANLLASSRDKVYGGRSGRQMGHLALCLQTACKLRSTPLTKVKSLQLSRSKENGGWFEKPMDRPRECRQIVFEIPSTRQRWRLLRLSSPVRLHLLSSAMNPAPAQKTFRFSSTKP
ncbi:kinase-like domain-containing protein [Mycena filopes]|nr:kinase-like domain-containing protein [Mycena filopes]